MVGEIPTLDLIIANFNRIISLFIVFCIPSFLFSLDYYWIGGSGNWSDLSHWVTSSGGTIQHDQIPTATDDVIFDQNSFSSPNNTITLNLDIIFTRNLDFRNINQNVILTGPSSSVIIIHGSLYFHPNVNLNFKGSFDFKSDAPGNELQWFSQKPFRLNFLGIGTWTIATDLEVDSLIHLEFGNLKFDPVLVKCYRFEVYSGNMVGLDFGSSTLEISGNRFLEMPSYRWKESLHFENGQVNVTPGNSTIKLTGTRASIGFYDITDIKLDQVELGIPGGDHLIFSSWNGNGFEGLHLFGNTFLQGEFNMNSLEMEGGNVYTFHSGFRQRVGTLQLNADCSSSAFLKANESGNPAIMQATQGAQMADFVMLQDIHIEGATFQATNAVDLGGNNGWNIQSKANGALFWIGGAGNWNDPNHWSFSSGGTPSGCIPDAADDVIFDQNSFTGANQQVIINTPNAFCHSMDWRTITQSCILSHSALSNKQFIHIFGSLWMSPMLSNEFPGDFLFESPHGNNEIQSAGNEFNLNVHFNSALGEWTLLDKLDQHDTLHFNAGILHTNDQEIECFHFYSRTGTKRELHLGKSVIRLVMTNKHPYYWSEISFNATNLTIFPGTSLFKCENQTSLNSWSNGTVNLYEILFESFGALNNDTGSGTELKIKKATFLGDGEFRREMDIDTLTFSPGWKYTAHMNSKIKVDSLSAHGDCDGSIYIAAFPAGITATLFKESGNLQVSEVMLEGIVAEGGATFRAISSIDMGGNQGWQFTGKLPRTLFWVGNDGIWHNRQNWSLSSGGMGGACIPTAIDVVIFDENSFTNDWQGVGLNGSRSAICKDMIWRNVPDFVGVYDGEISVTGDFTLEANINFDPWSLNFNSDSTGNQITTNGNKINWVNMMGDGDWTLLDNFQVPYQLNFWQGTFRTNSKKLSLGHFSMNAYPVDFSRTLILDDSHIVLSPMPIWEEQLYITSENFTIHPGTSLVEFVGDNALSRQYGSDTLTLHNVLFSNTAGVSTIEQWDGSFFIFNKLQFNNNGVMYGANFMDSLILAPGKEYKLEIDKTQEVNSYLLAIGNNCTPIAIRSTEPGIQSTVFSKSAKVVADFVQLQDQNATGGADFTAGAHSTDISNNTGWIFNPAPDHIEVGFLGEDRTLCRDSSITLSAFNFSPNEAYLWRDMSTDTTLNISAAGTYWAQVTFKNNCVIHDTVIVRDPLSLQVDLGPDSTLCAGEVLQLDGDLNFPEVMYVWQDGTQSSQYQVKQAGSYHLRAEVDGCSFTDTIDIDYNPIPEVDIQGAVSVCEGDTLLLDATLTGGTYQWQNNSIQPTLKVVNDGMYWVNVSVNGCMASDTLDITFTAKPPLDLGPDLELCEEEVKEIDVFVEDAMYLWNDGTDVQKYVIQNPGWYWVELTRANCSVRDSILIKYNPKPILPPFRDTALCEGTSLSINLKEPEVDYTWNTGLLTGSIDIDQTGLYQISADLNGCVREDEFQVDFQPPPVISLGQDFTLCEGEDITYSFSEPMVDYIWQDSINSPTFRIDQPGSYRLLAQKLNCERSDTLVVVVNPLPVFSLGPDLHLCPGDSFTLSPDLTTGNLSWHNGDSVLQFTGNTSGLYWLEMEDNDCTFRDSVEITNSDPILITLGKDTTLCEGKSYALDATHPNVQNYLWHDGTITPIKEINQPGLYQVELSDGACSFTFDIEIFFRECHYFAVYIPNVFSPNGDGVNDEFLPLINPDIQIDRYEFQIYDRWGSLVFSSSDPNQSWDGKINGEISNQDVFVNYLYVEYQDDDGPGTFKKGSSVTLIR